MEYKESGLWRSLGARLLPCLKGGRLGWCDKGEESYFCLLGLLAGKRKYLLGVAFSFSERRCSLLYMLIELVCRGSNSCSIDPLKNNFRL